MIKFIATCLTTAQENICQNFNIDVIKNYATSYGEISPNCVTDFSIHCFNSLALETLKELGVARATLHPELNLGQIRYIKKSIETEIIIYGRLPLMKLGNPQQSGELIDRKGIKFYIQDDILYNSVPIFMADKLAEIEKTGITHGRMIFTTESPEETRQIIKAYLNRKLLKINFTKGKYYSKV